MTSKSHSAQPFWKHPAMLGLVGIFLMLGGWKLSVWRPVFSDTPGSSNPRLQEIRGMSDDPDLTRRLDQIEDYGRAPASFELPGRLILFGGMALFVVAAYRMYRDPTGPPPDETPEPDQEVAAS